MQINPILNTENYNTRRSPSFGVWNREVYRSAEGKVFNIELAHRNTTYLFRNKNFWKPFVTYMATVFKDIPHINVYDFGCSDGSEAYTLIMSLFSHLKKEIAEKFLPIIAKDYDSYAIDTAKKGRIAISCPEECNINDCTCHRFNDFFEEIPDVVYSKEPLYSPKNILKDNVTFEIGNICEDYKNIIPDNSIVFARNFWPYLEEKEKLDLIKNLHNTLGENSYLVIGKFDIENCSLNKCIESFGFKPVLSDYVFKKDN